MSSQSPMANVFTVETIVTSGCVINFDEELIYLETESKKPISFHTFLQFIEEGWVAGNVDGSLKVFVCTEGSRAVFREISKFIQFVQTGGETGI